MADGAVPEEPTAIAVDPFGLWPSARSAIRGLGGDGPARSPKYAFASPHCAAVDGRIEFVLEFQELHASDGVLRLRIAAQRETGRRSRWVVDERVDLAKLAREGGRWRVRCRSRADTLYALTGQLEGAPDASASGLRLTLHGSGGGRRAEARLRPMLDASSGRRAPRLVSFDGRGRRTTAVAPPPTLAAPVSQMCTAAQMEEPTYRAWLDRLHVAHQWHRKQWEVVYVLQTLEGAERIRPGARGLGFGSGSECFSSYLASRGCDVLATDLSAADQGAAGWIETGQHSREAAGLFHPAICTREAFDRHVAFREVDMRRIPADLTGFDVCWSACAFEHLGSIAAGLAFVEASLRCLKPGGLAVHTTELNLTSDGRTVDHADTVLFRRRDMERLAHRLARRGHRVAPLNFHAGDQPRDRHVDVPPYAAAEHLRIALGRYVATSFGIIVEKAAA